MIGEIRQNFTEASASVGLILATALNPGKQVGTQNKDFGTVLQTEFIKSLVPSVRQAFFLWRVVGRGRYNSLTPAWEAIARS